MLCQSVQAGKSDAEKVRASLRPGYWLQSMNRVSMINE